MNDYKPLEIEEKWRKKWEEEKIYQPNLDGSTSLTTKKSFYNLMMFPYPSAEGLHVGNVYAFTGADTYGRLKRMQGNDVFEPMGLDGFGIHSENYALKIGKHPKEQAEISSKNFYRQLRSIGNGFDWSRKVETYDPSYYKWTQWIFIQLFNRGLAYRKKAPVNFCPKDLTVLSDEQVVNGLCERCGSSVEKRNLEQWFFKITDYAERLLNNIPQLNWTEKVKIAQKEWIGRSEGTRIEFKIQNSKFKIQVFTTRADTLYGATFIVVAPEHEILKQAQDDKRKEVQDYIKKAKEKTEIERTAEGKEKTGVFTGLYAINPLSNQPIPVWVADYALMGYGTGALFGDAHDERDVEFAKRYKIPLKPTIKTGEKEKDRRIVSLEECYTGEGTLFDSGEFSGLSSKEARRKIAQWLSEKGKGERTTTYHLRDWLISRQRYWGPPIPMIFCEKCALKKISDSSGVILGSEATPESKKETNSGQAVRRPESLGGELRTIEPLTAERARMTENPMAGWFPVPEDQLPVLLPDVKDWKPKGEGVSPLANIKEFVHTKCPNCGGEARRETDVSDTFLDSSWYFFRYLATESKDTPFPSEGLKSVIARSEVTKQSQKDHINRRVRWLPVTMYIGGAEHSVLHLLYSRFVTMVFKDMGLIDFEEPFVRFYAHGLIIKDGAKMSKSKGNVVNPDEYLAKYGADTLRCYLRFVGPFDMGGDFRDSGIEGMHRFLKRIWKFVSDVILEEAHSTSSVRPIGSSQKDSIPSFPQGKRTFQNDTEGKRMMHKTIKGVTEDLEDLRFNTAVAKLMTWYNYLVKQKDVSQEEITAFLKLLAPIAPFLTEELYQSVIASSKGAAISEIATSQASRDDGGFQSIHSSPWPTYDEKYLIEDEVTIAVQVNGKLRDMIIVQSSKLKVKGELEELAKNKEKIQRYLDGQVIKKVIYIPGKVINFVI